MQYQASQIIHDSQIPTSHEIQTTLSSVREQYGDVVKQVPDIFLRPYDRDLVRTYIVQHVYPLIEEDSSPGVPYSVGSINSNRKLVDEQGDLILELALDRIERLIDFDCCGSSVDLLHLDLCDPVRLFVKNEPHKLEKILKKRFRLISSVSLLDQIVERLLNGFINQQEILAWRQIPSQAGMGFTESSNEHIYNRVHDRTFVKPVSDNDVSAWDWSCKAWLLGIDVDIRFSLLSKHKVHGWWLSCSRARNYCLCNSVFQLSDGRLISQNFSGLQKSGSYNTSSTNSHCRTFLAKLIGADFVIDMGDDAVEDWVCDAVEKYLGYGFRVKSYVKRTINDIEDSGFEFCSHQYTQDSCVPLNAYKTFMSYVHNVSQDSLLVDQWSVQFLNDIWDSPFFYELLALLSCAGWCAEDSLAKAFVLLDASKTIDTMDPSSPGERQTETFTTKSSSRSGGGG